MGRCPLRYDSSVDSSVHVFGSFVHVFGSICGL
jgi:hypothetical protein